jgi:hypothetical protein
MLRYHALAGSAKPENSSTGAEIVLYDSEHYIFARSIRTGYARQTRINDYSTITCLHDYPKPDWFLTGRILRPPSVSSKRSALNDLDPSLFRVRDVHQRDASPPRLSPFKLRRGKRVEDGTDDRAGGETYHVC